MLLYDLTTYFEGEPQEVEKARAATSPRSPTGLQADHYRAGCQPGRFSALLRSLREGNRADVRTLEDMLEAVERKHGRALAFTFPSVSAQLAFPWREASYGELSVLTAVGLNADYKARFCEIGARVPPKLGVSVQIFTFSLQLPVGKLTLDEFGKCKRQCLSALSALFFTRARCSTGKRWLHSPFVGVLQSTAGIPLSFPTPVWPIPPCFDRFLSGL